MPWANVAEVAEEVGVVEVTVQALLSIVKMDATVLRDGHQTNVPVEEIVPDDICILNAGDIIPGDASIVESKDLLVDEAALTGESYPAEKQTGVVPNKPR